jgi:hypothetical protein
VLATFLAGSVAWAFDAHALSDLVAAQQPAGDTRPAPDGDTHHSSPGGADCNHGCHFASHLLGQLSASPQLPIIERDRLRPLTQAAFAFDTPEPLDRPPAPPSRD